MQSVDTRDTRSLLWRRIVSLSGVFLLVAVPLFYFPGSIRPFLWPKLLIAQVGAIIVTGGWFLQCWRSKTQLGWNPLDLPVIALALVVTMSLPISINSYKGSMELVKLFTFVVLYFSISRTFSFSCVQAWTYTICVVSGVVSVIGILQFLGIGFMWIPTGGQPSATFLYRNYAAMFLIMALPSTLVLFLLTRDLKREVLFGVVCTLVLVFLVYTRTRGAWVALGCTLTIFTGLAVWNVRMGTWKFVKNLDDLVGRKTVVAACCLAILILMVQASPGMQDTPGVGIPETKTKASAAAWSILEGRHSGRLLVWRHTLELIQDHWLRGVGIGNWELIYPQYALGEFIRPGWTFLRPHNDYLMIASELGIFGLIIFIWLFFTAIRLVVKTLLKTKDAVEGLIMVGAGMSLFAISLHASFSFPRERITPSLLFWLMLGIISGISSRDRRRAEPGRARRLYLPAFLIIALLTGIFPAYAAFMADREHFVAASYQAKERWDDAKSAADRSIGWGVCDYRIFFLKAQACLAMGDYEAALDANQRCLMYHPNSMSAFQNIGKLSAKLGDLETAEEAFRNALSLDPDNGGLYHDLGLTLGRRGKVDQALAAYEKAIEKGAGSSVLRFNRAGLYRRSGQLDSSIVDFQQAVRLDPGFFQPHVAIAELQQVLGKRDSAVVIYERAIELNSQSPEPYYNLGNLYLEKGENQDAANAFKKFLELWVGDSETSERVRELLGKLEY